MLHTKFHLLRLTITDTSKVVSMDGQDVTGKLRPFSLLQPTMEAADFSDRLSLGQSGVV